MLVRAYQTEDQELWDNFIEQSTNATFLHSRKFLSYHSDKFIDRSLVIEEEGKIIGLFPAAINPSEQTEIVSHPGSTYGGIVQCGKIKGEKMIEAVQEIMKVYKSEGYNKILYKAVPNIYHKIPSSDDLYALFRLGAKRYRCDLAATIDLENRPPLVKGRKSSLKKAIRNNVEIHFGYKYIKEFWSVLEEGLLNKYNTQPVHTLEEMEKLIELFPDNINCCIGLHDNKVVAGIILFDMNTLSHAQYISSSEKGNELGALDLVIDESIKRAVSTGKRYFDFGTNNENQGKYLNESLYKFKCLFGAGGAVYEFYELHL